MKIRSKLHVLGTLCAATAWMAAVQSASAQVHRYHSPEFNGAPFWNQGFAIVGKLGQPMTRALDSSPGGKRFRASGLPPGLTLDEATGVLTGKPLALGSFEAMLAVESEGHPPDFHAHRIIIEEPRHLLLWTPPFLPGDKAVIRLRTGTSYHSSSFYTGPIQGVDVQGTLPPGLAWSPGEGQFTGSPTKGGIFQVPGTLQTADQEMPTLVSFDITPRESDLVLDESWQYALIGDGKVVLLDTRSRALKVGTYRGVTAANEIAYEHGTLPAGISQDIDIGIRGYALGNFYLIAGDRRLFVSSDGLSWREATVPFEAWLPYGVSVSARSLILAGQSPSPFVMTMDFDTFKGVTPLDLDPPPGRGSVTQISRIVDAEDSWLLYTGTNDVYRSTDFETWSYLGMCNIPLEDAYKVADCFLGTTYSGSNRSLHHSADGLHWARSNLFSDDVDDSLRLFHDGLSVIVMHDDSIYRTMDGLNFAFVRKVDFGTRRGWQASSLDDVFGFFDEVIIARDESSPPNVIGRWKAPLVERLAVEAGQRFDLRLQADREPVQFHAYNLPDGISLDESSGVISGILDTPGTYQWHVNASNAFGEGPPSLVHVICYEAGLENTGPQLKAFRDTHNPFHEEPFLLPRGVFSGTPSVRFVIETDTAPEATVIQAVNLPPGLSIDHDSGAVVGEASVGGKYVTTFTLSSPGGQTQFERTFIVYDYLNGSVELDNRQLGVELGAGTSMKARAQPARSGVEFLGYNLPPGLTLNPATGTITGAYQSIGTFRYAVIGRTAAGEYLVPAGGSVEVKSTYGGRLPEPWPVLMAEPGQPGLALPLNNGERVEITETPGGIEFIPPATIIFDDELDAGVYAFDYRKINALGKTDGRASILVPKAQLSATHVRWELSESNQPLVGVPLAAAPVIEGIKPERFLAVNLPDGLSMDETGGVISGVPRVSGSSSFAVMHVLGNASRSNYHSASVWPGPEGWNDHPESRRITGVQDQLERWELDFPISSVAMAVDLVSGPAGVMYDYDVFENAAWIEGAPATAARGNLLFQIDQEPETTQLQMPYHFYDTPQWGSWWSHGRHVPPVSLFLPGFDLLVRRSAGFFQPAQLYSRRGSAPWETLAFALPGNVPQAAAIDLTAGGGGYLLSYGNYISLNASFNNLDKTWRELNVHITRVAAGDGVFALITDKREFLITQDGVDFEGGGSRSDPALFDLAYGKGLFVAVGDQGQIRAIDPAGNFVSTGSPLQSAPSAQAPYGGQNRLNAITFDGTRFVAVGSHGAIISSEDGVHWQVERSVSDLGESFQHVTHNSDVIVALGITKDLGRPAGTEEPWVELTRLATADPFTDSLQWPDGKAIGREDGLLVPARPQTDNAFLIGETLWWIAGLPLNFPILTLREADTLVAEGLPPGLHLDDSTQTIVGTPEQSGVWESLVEMETDGKRIGQILSFEIHAARPVMPAQTFNVVVGYPFDFTLPVPDDAEAVRSSLSLTAVDLEMEGNVLHLRGVFETVGVVERELEILSRTGSAKVPITIRVHEPRPLIVRQPESQNLIPDGETVLSVGVQGQWPMSFQWYRDGVPIDESTDGVSGTRTELLTIQGDAHAGEYDIVVSNDLGEMRSVIAFLHRAHATLSYDAWAGGRGIPENRRGPLDDANGNGWENLVEYALLGSADGSQLLARSPAIHLDAGTRVLVFEHAADTENVVVSLEKSIDLRNWSTVEPNLLQSLATESSIQARYEINSSVPEPQLYFRLRITKKRE